MGRLIRGGEVAQSFLGRRKRAARDTEARELDAGTSSGKLQQPSGGEEGLATLTS